jgi:hypothetical protein
LIVIIFLGAVVLTIFFPYLLDPESLIYPNSGFSSDLVTSFWPRLLAWSEHLAGGGLQLWNDSTISGHPISMVGDLRAYPPALLSLVLPSGVAITAGKQCNV